ncbi:MAG: ABC transporter substrate-binding protein [Ideonella sp.]|nr:ABC transporter substrate-binding protein [Ideonella sp.]
MKTTLTRRPVVLAALSLLLAASRPAPAQRASRVARVGILSQGGPPPEGTRWPVHGIFVDRLRELGWTEGVNLQLEFRYGHSTAAGIVAAAGELAALKPDVLVASGTPGIRALLDATRTIPIVMAGAGDPVGTGLVASLARPGGNVTGVSLLGQEILAKASGLLHELLPKARRIDLLGSAVNPANDYFARVWADAVRMLGVEGRMVIVPHAEDIEPTIAGVRADAIVVLPDPMFVTNPQRLFDACLRRRLPAATTGGNAYAHGGALLNYSVNFDDLYRQGAVYVDRILRGANPADTPVEQPSRYELILNLKTARALGLKLPQSLLLQATEVIE